MLTTKVFVFVCILIGVNSACPNGWQTHGDMCYHFSHDTENFPGAKIMCEALGGRLVEIQSAAQNNYLATLIDSTKPYYWIGLSDVQEEGTWVWMGSMEPADYTNWRQDEPNNAQSDENCVLIDNTGEWNDYTCHENAHYICERQAKTDGEIVG